MGAVLIILGSLVGVGAVLYLLHRRNPSDEPAPEQRQPEECCGQHSVCERDSLLMAVQEKPEYFDDEELDEYQGRPADSYTPDEIEQFRDVLLTLQPSDVAPWARSIQLRGVNLPVAVRDELLMIVAESRSSTN